MRFQDALTLLDHSMFIQFHFSTWQLFPLKKKGVSFFFSSLVEQRWARRDCSTYLKASDTSIIDTGEAYFHTEVLSLFYIDIGHFPDPSLSSFSHLPSRGKTKYFKVAAFLFSISFAYYHPSSPANIPDHIMSRHGRPSAYSPLKMQIINFSVVFISFHSSDYRGGWAVDSWLIWHAFVYLFDFLPLLATFLAHFCIALLVVLVLSSSFCCFASQLPNPFGPRLCMACPVLSRASRSLQLIPWKRSTKIDIEAGLPWELAKTRNGTKRDRWE